MEHRFDRRFFDGRESFTSIGTGSIGGKAGGLGYIRDVLARDFDAGRYPGIEVVVPTLTVLATGIFETFMEEGGLREIAHSDLPDDQIAHAFQHAPFPAPYLGDLRALVQQVHRPLAIRSSSLLEDAMFRPFAGVYETKMIPNNQADPDVRFRKIIEAIKFVYASTFFRGAKNYLRAADRGIDEERMAVIIQEVIGERHGPRFYPHLSGVARSVNFYPTANARPEDGVVSLALGLGKTIVDGGICWSYSPAYPRSVPPYGSPGDLLNNTQTGFWAVNMGDPPAFDPLRETEYMVYEGLAEAEWDGVLNHLVSTYDGESDRLVTGIGRSGPRALTFAPILSMEVLPLTSLLKELLELSERQIGAKVEIEFAATLTDEVPARARFGFLQVRPLVISQEEVGVSPEEMSGADVLVASESVLGNGQVEGLRDVVYLKPAAFDIARSRELPAVLERFNRDLAAANTPYVLIGFGRWGSSDPWLGVPVQWDQIAGAKAIVEATLPGLNPEPSQGSHFFHNVTSFRVCYFSVPHTGRFPILWDRLDREPAVTETEVVRHVRFREPLDIRVDGRVGRGIIRIARGSS